MYSQYKTFFQPLYVHVYLNTIFCWTNNNVDRSSDGYSRIPTISHRQTKHGKQSICVISRSRLTHLFPVTCRRIYDHGGTNIEAVMYWRYAINTLTRIGPTAFLLLRSEFVSYTKALHSIVYQLWLSVLSVLSLYSLDIYEIHSYRHCFSLSLPL